MWGRARKFTTQLLQNSTVHIFLILLHILVPAPYSIYKGSGENNTAMLPPTSDLTIAIEAPNFSAKQLQKTQKKWSHRKSPLLFLLPSSLRPLTPKSSDRKPLRATGKQIRRHRHHPKPKQNKTKQGGKKTERERDSTKEAKSVSKKKKKKKILGKTNYRWQEAHCGRHWGMAWWASRRQAISQFSLSPRQVRRL